MKLSLDDFFWIVTDPPKAHIRRGNLFECTLRDLFREIRGGLNEGENPILYSNYREAVKDANTRSRDLPYLDD